MTPEAFARRHPRLYHMVEADSWPSIRRHGLLSTSALLDLFEVRASTRYPIESQHRPQSVPLHHAEYGKAVTRDQKAANDSRLQKCIQDGMQTPQWYELLNGKVFFWVTEQRLNRFLRAAPYRRWEHLVLTFDTTALLERYLGKVTVSAINSGATLFPAPPKRGPDTFRGLRDQPRKEVVELAVEYKIRAEDINRWAFKGTLKVSAVPRT